MTDADASWKDQQDMRRQLTRRSWYKSYLPYVLPALFLGAVLFMAVAALI